MKALSGQCEVQTCLRDPESQQIMPAPMFHMENDFETFDSSMEKVVYTQTVICRRCNVMLIGSRVGVGGKISFTSFSYIRHMWNAGVTNLKFCARFGRIVVVSSSCPTLKP